MIVSGVGPGFDGDGFERAAVFKPSSFKQSSPKWSLTVRFAAHISWSTSSRTPGKNVYAPQKKQHGESDPHERRATRPSRGDIRRLVPLCEHAQRRGNDEVDHRRARRLRPTAECRAAIPAEDGVLRDQREHREDERDEQHGADDSGDDGKNMPPSRAPPA